MQRWYLRLAYDGTDYFGWQRLSEEPETPLGSPSHKTQRHQRGRGGVGSTGAVGALGGAVGSSTGAVDVVVPTSLATTAPSLATTAPSPSPPTVQGQLDIALARVFRYESIKSVGSSRTDRGVHARGQVCHFDVPSGVEESAGAEVEASQEESDGRGQASQEHDQSRSGRKSKPKKKESSPAHCAARRDAAIALHRLRRCLPRGIQAVALGKAQGRDRNDESPGGFGFHARLSATRKVYSYRLCLTEISDPFRERYCWYCGKLDVGLLEQAGRLFDGKKFDYGKAFTTANMMMGTGMSTPASSAEESLIALNFLGDDSKNTPGGTTADVPDMIGTPTAGGEPEPQRAYYEPEYHGDPVKTVSVEVRRVVRGKDRSYRVVGDGRKVGDSHETVGSQEQHVEYLDQHVEDLDSEIEILLATSDRFLYRMCRRIVGCMVEIARGKLQVDFHGDDGATTTSGTVTSAAVFSRKQVPTAPAEGLCLERVEFPNDVDLIDGTGY